MCILNSSPVRVILAAVFVLAAIPPSAAAAPISFTGHFGSDDDIEFFLITLTATESFQVYTNSYAAGGFDPVLSFFYPEGSIYNDDDGSAGPGACAHPEIASGANGCFDAYLELTFGPGKYLLALSESANYPLGELSQGFVYDGAGDFTGVPFGPGKGNSWTVTINGADSVAAEAPEPGTARLALAGLLMCALVFRRGRGWLAAAVVCCSASGAYAASLPVAADAYISQANATGNYGAATSIAAGNGSTALFRFDTGSMPPGIAPSKVTKATLIVYANKVGSPGLFDAVGISSSWSESAVTAASAPAINSISTATASATAAGVYISFDVTALVKMWLTTGQDYGIAITANAANPSATVYLDSKENAATSHAAVLNIEIAAEGEPGPAGQAATVAVGTVTTGAAGSPASVLNSGSASAAVLNFSIPQGQQGAPGPQGPGGLSYDKVTWGFCVAAPCAVNDVVANPYIAVATLNVSKCYLAARTPPTGADLMVQILRNDIPTATLTLPAGSRIASSSAPITVVEGDLLTARIAQAGSSTPGGNLTVTCKLQ